MFKTLRGQLILSHILPSLIIIPLMGILLVYFLENRIVLPGLMKQLADDAFVVASFAGFQPEVFENPQLAQELVDRITPESPTRLMLLDLNGLILASNSPDDNDRLHQAVEKVGVEEAKKGLLTKQVDFSEGLHGNVVDVFAPVKNADGAVIGIVRLSYRYTTVIQQILGLRYLLLAILSFGILLNASLGFALALSIGNPVRNVTQAIFDLARGARTDRLPEEGPAEIKMLQQAANFLVARLRELEQSRRQLLANLVHELGRPLGGLHMGIQVLRRGAKEDPQVLDELLQGMETETSLLQVLLEDLSHLHDQVVGNLELNLRKVAISTWLTKVLSPSKSLAQQKGLVWESDIPETLPTLEVDPDRMAQAIGNLINNAIKYTPRGGTVSVTAGIQGQELRIRVCDTGPGIPEGEQAQIFEPFFRGTQRQRIKQGMGLGLSIARDLVTAHHGRLDVSSTPGKGSCFTIWLPNI